MDPLPNSLSACQLLPVMMDRYTKLLRPVMTSQTSDLPIGSLFLDNWVVLYKILKYVLSYNEAQFTCIVFESPCPS